MEPQEKFWMCLCEGGHNAPQVKHTDIIKATEEAHRLAHLTRRRVHILETIGGYDIVSPVIEPFGVA